MLNSDHTWICLSFDQPLEKANNYYMLLVNHSFKFTTIDEMSYRKQTSSLQLPEAIEEIEVNTHKHEIITFV